MVTLQQAQNQLLGLKIRITSMPIVHNQDSKANCKYYKIHFLICYLTPSELMEDAITTELRDRRNKVIRFCSYFTHIQKLEKLYT